MNRRTQYRSSAISPRAARRGLVCAAAFVLTALGCEVEYARPEQSLPDDVDSTERSKDQKLSRWEYLEYESVWTSAFHHTRIEGEAVAAVLEGGADCDHLRITMEVAFTDPDFTSSWIGVPWSGECEVREEVETIQVTYECPAATPSVLVYSREGVSAPPFTVPAADAFSSVTDYLECEPVFATALVDGDLVAVAEPNSIEPALRWIPSADLLPTSTNPSFTSAVFPEGGSLRYGFDAVARDGTTEVSSGFHNAPVPGEYRHEVNCGFGWEEGLELDDVAESSETFGSSYNAILAGLSLRFAAEDCQTRIGVFVSDVAPWPDPPSAPQLP